MELIRPCEKYVEQYREAIREDEKFRPRAEKMYANPDTVVEQSKRFEAGVELPMGYVRQTTFWLIDDGRFIGEIGVRHSLTPFLLRYGGNIGYVVRYSESGKGYCTKMLAMALAYCRDELKLDKVLITCDDDNYASAAVIEKNGGVMENKVINHLDRGTVTTRRYYISLLQ
ncbi:MAG: GNAT family N-acetyltransferase [Lachnospiraceae bacterium]|nr:GNAT family N-acetyltransferase [Lachnospiraceae bacterium]